MSEKPGYEGFCSNRAKLAWIVYTRPDICSATARLSQVTQKLYDEDSQLYERLLEKTFERLKATPNVILRYPNLDKKSLRIRAYADASFGANPDGSSQLGFIVLLMDKDNKFAIIKYRSGKCRRIVHSAMAAECCALAECFDAAYVLKHELQVLLKQEVNIEVLTYSKQVFDSITNSTRTKERRLMIDLNAAKESFQRKEISDLGLLKSENNLADAFTKLMAPKQLLEAMTSGELNHDIENWILR